MIYYFIGNYDGHYSLFLNGLIAKITVKLCKNLNSVFGCIQTNSGDPVKKQLFSFINWGLSVLAVAVCTKQLPEKNAAGSAWKSWNQLQENANLHHAAAANHVKTPTSSGRPPPLGWGRSRVHNSMSHIEFCYVVTVPVPDIPVAFVESPELIWMQPYKYWGYCGFELPLSVHLLFILALREKMMGGNSPPGRFLCPERLMSILYIP